MIRCATIYPAQHLLDVTRHLLDGNTLHSLTIASEAVEMSRYGVDMSEVKGQAHAKRALEIAAAGQHSLLFIGPLGTGKSMLTERLPTIMPPMTEQETLETAAVQSLVSGVQKVTVNAQRPYRAPSSHGFFCGTCRWWLQSQTG